MQTMVEESKIRTLPAVRVTRSERQALELEARRLGLSLSDYTRQAIRAYTTLTRGGFVYGQPTQGL